uniref:Uncharacterized protein n=1 Tax=Tanacetum cinerariifolium TaxID=118510 RepID=A0A699GSC8_TANCI|nr:hypothetical protein [Tanacetum cinerariifolium]
MLMKCIGELKHVMANLIQDNKHLEERLDSYGARLYTLENLNTPKQVSEAMDEIVTDAVDWAVQASLRNRFRDLPEADIKEILQQRMWETNSYKTHEDHMMLYEALEKSMNCDHYRELLKDLDEAHKKKKKKCDSPKTPPGSPPHQPSLPPPPAGPSGTSGSPGASESSQVPPPPPSTNQEGQSHGSTAPSSSKTAASAKYKAWTTTDTRLRLSVSSTPEDQQMDDDMAPDAQVHSSDDEDIENAHILKVNFRQDWWKPLEEDRPATPEPAWSIPSSDVPVLKNNWASAFASTYSPPPEDSLLAQNGDMAMFMDWFCKRQGITELIHQDLEGHAFEHVKVFHHNMWIEEECKYDIAAMYGISHWWFQRQRFYIDKHTFKGDRRAVRTHIRILSVVRIEVFSMYGDFEDLYLLNLQGHLNHLPPKDKKILTIADNLWTRNLVIRQRIEDFQLRIESYQTQLNLTKTRWDATGFEYKHDYTVIDSSRAITFQDRYGVQMIMRFNEIHKFSDGTLHQIDEALDYRVKEFKVNRMNLGLNIRSWIRKDVDRSKKFMFTIQKRLKTRRIFRNLESFVGGRVRDGDYRLLKHTE